MGPEFINEEWLEYRGDHVPDYAKKQELVSAKKAYFAGAAAMLHVLQTRGVCTISTLRAELAQFNKAVEAGEEILP